MQVTRHKLTALALALCMGLSLSASAQPPHQEPLPKGHTRVPPPRPAADGLGRAVADIEQRTGGRVLSAERAERDGRPMYRIKLLTPDGHVKVIWRDAEGRR